MSILKRLYYRCLWLLLGLFIVIALVTLFFLVKIEQELPSVDNLNHIQLQVPLRIFSQEGELIAEFGLQRRMPLKFADFPPQLIQAVLATEDARFFEHGGVDFRGLIRATSTLLITGNKSQGGSTITMQVARNFFLTRKKTYLRKLQEILLAIKIERQLAKEKILELYLNKIYFGNRAYGVGTAAQVYYGKPLQALNLAQLAMLAGLPKAPSALNPIYNPNLALKRRNHVLARMQERGYIDDNTLNTNLAQPLTASYHGLNITLNAPYVAEIVRNTLVNQLGVDTAYTGGYNVYTTISSTLQRTANQALRKNLLAYDKRHGYRGPLKNLGHFASANLAVWQEQLKQQPIINGLIPAIITSVEEQAASALVAEGQIVQLPWQGLQWARQAIKKKYVGPLPKSATEILQEGDMVYIEPLTATTWQLSQIPELEGALVALNPHNGQILSLVGGFDFISNKFNHATQAKRQVGSAFKPFIYSAALAKGFTAATLINDAPIVLADPSAEEEWRPQNSNHQFYGPTRLRIGLVKSRNMVSIRLLEAIGIPYALDYIHRLGLQVDKLPKTLSLVLGTGEMTPLELTKGYATFANGGYQITPYLIHHITDSKGNLRYRHIPTITPALEKDTPTQAPMAPQVITPQNAYLMTNMLQDVIQSGTGRAIKVLGRHDLAGKTGTTNDLQDAWFAGFNGNLVTTVWVGFDQPRSIREYAAQAAIPLWIDFMGEALKGQPDQTLEEPSHMVTLPIDPTTGKTVPFEQENAIFEIFSEEYPPDSTSAETLTTDSFTSNDDSSLPDEVLPSSPIAESQESQDTPINNQANDETWEEAAQLF